MEKSPNTTDIADVFMERISLLPLCESVSLIIDMRNSDDRGSVPIRRWCKDNMDVCMSKGKRSKRLPTTILFHTDRETTGALDFWRISIYFFSASFWYPCSFFFSLCHLFIRIFALSCEHEREATHTKHKEAADETSNNNLRRRGKKGRKVFGLFSRSIRAVRTEKTRHDCTVGLLYCTNPVDTKYFFQFQFPPLSKTLIPGRRGNGGEAIAETINRTEA